MQAALFRTGDERLESLYRTSLINLFLLRTRYAAAQADGHDIYTVKPGVGVYDLFWDRDGAYITAAMDRVGLHEEAEKSLDVFWRQSDKAPLRSWVQKPDGRWDGSELDAQGEAPWTLVNHYRLTADEDYLRRVYPSLRKSASGSARLS